jgi:hypothetical protein
VWKDGNITLFNTIKDKIYAVAVTTYSGGAGFYSTPEITIYRSQYSISGSSYYAYVLFFNQTAAEPTTGITCPAGTVVFLLSE